MPTAPGAVWPSVARRAADFVGFYFQSIMIIALVHYNVEPSREGNFFGGILKGYPIFG